MCNAYPFTSALDIFVGTVKLTRDPLPYKVCDEYSPALVSGDRVEFKVADTNAGTFTISELPNYEAVLLVVIFRHDTLTTAVAFESHVFSNVASAQIAVLDTYKGRATSDLRIQDTTWDPTSGKGSSRSELLRFDSVVAVDPGAYEAMLVEADNSIKAKKELVAVPKEAYVVIRCGVEAQEGPVYPQELMVYPLSDKTALGGTLRAHSLTSRVAAILIWALLGIP